MVEASKASPVLVVEDDVEIRDLVREVLEDEGYAVVVAEHGREAVEALESGLSPALILLDLMMPVMDGWELLDVLRARWSKIPVTVVSAVADRARLGAVPFIKKPINLDTLIDAVNGVCRP
ncbi:MAG TPA: response regulator [Minicystis sp.]|nr:response regulator [Minicystis sp.]